MLTWCTFSDYHAEDIINIQNTSPIFITGKYWYVTTQYDGGIFTSRALRNDWGFGLNANANIGSRLSKNQVQVHWFSAPIKIFDYHYSRSSLIGLLCGSWNAKEPKGNEGIFVGIGVNDDNYNGSHTN